MASRIQQVLASESLREYYGGALMLLIGAGAVEEGIKYQVGSLSQMGPGFFPVALGVILALLGVAIAGSARSHVGDARPVREKDDIPGPEWRGWICILGSVVAFVVMGKYGGLLPATFAIVFIAALGDRNNGVVTALVLSLILCLLCVVIFWWALQLQFPLFTWG
jgi:Tripartite tricarboxylate transporter TctB family